MKRLILTLLFIGFIFSIPQKSSSLILGPGGIPIVDLFSKKVIEPEQKNKIIEKSLKEYFSNNKNWTWKIEHLPYKTSSAKVYFNFNKKKTLIFTFVFRFINLNNNYILISNDPIIFEKNKNIVYLINQLKEQKK